jgi:hypothetical protein
MALVLAAAGRPWALVWTLVGAAILLAVLGVVLLARRR